MNKLRKMGALDVSRSYGSHGVFDIRALFSDHSRWIQVKRKYMKPSELKHLKALGKKITSKENHIELWWFPKGKLEIVRLN